MVEMVEMVEMVGIRRPILKNRLKNFSMTCIAYATVYIICM